MKNLWTKEGYESNADYPCIYEDELFYSYIARYHFYSRNTNKKDTLYQIFDSISIIPTIEFPSKLKNVEEKLLQYIKLDSDLIIKKHTIFPYYSPFLPEDIRSEIIETMKYKDGKGIKTKIGMIAGGLCRSNGLKYCPLCVEDDYKNIGELYFHRIHQLQGLIICPKHKCILMKYPLNERSRIEFVKMDKQYTSSECQFIKDKLIEKTLFELSIGAKFLLDNDIDFSNQEFVHNKYLYLLKEKKFLTIEGHIRQDELCEEIVKHYGNKLLNMLESEIDIPNNYNWVKVLTRNPRRAVHPIRHLLLIFFLVGNVDIFFNSNYSTKEEVNYYPCLNPVSNHYKKFVVSKCLITADYKTREPVGTFSCDCGFIYSRKMSDDIFKVGTIKSFGYIWEQKLKEELSKPSNTLIEISRRMKVDRDTVRKYCAKLGISPNWRSKGNKLPLLMDTSAKLATVDNNIGLEYSNRIQNYIAQNIEFRISATDVRKKFKKEYAWLYRHNRELLKNILPKPRTSTNPKPRINWESRDNEISILLKGEIERLRLGNVPYRITLSKVGRKLNILKLLEKYKNKLPKTKKILDECLESVSRYQIRRVCRVIEELKQGNMPIKEWIVYKEAGIGNNCSAIVKDEISELVNRANSI